MPITRALEFDQTPNKLLYEIGQQAAEEKLMQRKLEQDNMEKQYQLLQQINPATLYPKFEKEVVDQTVGGLVSNMTSYIRSNPNASYVDLQNTINKGLGEVSEWSARVKTVKDAVKQNVGAIPADSPYNKSRLQALALDRALYKTDELGRKVIKSPEEIDLETDYVSEAMEDDTAVDPFKGQENALKMIQQAPLTKLDDTKTIETPDGRKTTKTGTVSELPFYLQNKDGKLSIKQDESGYIDETVYGTFYTNPATKAWVNAGAKDIIKKLGVPESPEANEYFKRAYLTNWLEVQTKGDLKKVNDTLYAKPTSTDGGSGKTDDVFMDVYNEINTAATSGDQVRELKGGKVTKIFGAAVNQLSPDAQGYLINVANKSKQKLDDEGNAVEFTQDDLVIKTEGGKLGLYQYPSGNMIAPLDKVQTNVKNNPTAKTKQNAINSATKPKSSINKSDIPAKAKAAGYTTAEYETLLKQRGVKII